MGAVWGICRMRDVGHFAHTWRRASWYVATVASPRLGLDMATCTAQHQSINIWSDDIGAEGATNSVSGDVSQSFEPLTTPRHGEVAYSDRDGEVAYSDREAI